jgi:hypothetical protein
VLEGRIRSVRQDGSLLVVPEDVDSLEAQA